MKNLLIAANFNLDYPLAEYPPIARRIRRQESLERLDLLVEEALRVKTDGVIIAGNLFYRDYPSPAVWKGLNNMATKLAENGIPLVILEGDNDKGPLYAEKNTGFFVISYGQTKEFLPDIQITVGTDLSPNGITFWRGSSPPPSGQETGLLVFSGKEWDTSDAHRLIVGPPVRLGFDGPMETAFGRIVWENCSISLETIPLQDRMAATVRWDVEEKGEDLTSYLLERQDANLSLKVIVMGKTSNPLNVQQWEHQFAPGYFLLQIEDQTVPVPISGNSPLAGDEFYQRMANLLNQHQASPQEVRRIKAAWVYGRDALKGGGQREN